MVVALLSLLLPDQASSQAVGTQVRGRVLTEEGGRPVPALEVRFRGGPAVTTSRKGEYRAGGLMEGWHDVALVTAGCEVALGRIRVSGGGEWVTNLSLPEAMARSHARLLPGEGEGIFLGAADLNEVPASTLADALRRALPELSIGTPAQPGQTAGVEGRNRATATGSTTPLFELDGMRLGNDPRILWDLAPGDVAWVQVIRGASGAWRYGTDGSGGVIRIFTRKGGGEAAAPGLPGRCPGVSWPWAGTRRP